MSPRDEDRAGGDDLDGLVDDALGPLFPTTEAEVERAEASGVERAELPASLAKYRPVDRTVERAKPAPESPAVRAAVLSPRGGWRTVATHGVAVALGLAAGAALLTIVRSTPQPIGRTGETAGPSASAQTNAATATGPIDLLDVDRCAECCAGSSCSAAPADLSTCPSGASCIACSGEQLLAQEYRLKLGSFIPSELGKKALENGPLEVCARVGASENRCAPARSDAKGERWLDIPLTLTGGEALGGVTVSLRYVGAKQMIGEWYGAVSVTAGLLCKGMFIQPALKNGDVLGTMSLFMSDAYFVELASGAATSELVARAEQYRVSRAPMIRETTRPGDGRFVLTLGPMPKSQAERIRWTLVDRGYQGKLSLGDDFVGEARP
ncbi:MAG: hypothetical protein U0271_14055 [Polyangiaceae bacterium]